MKLYRLDALFGKSGTGYVSDDGGNLRFFGASGPAGDFKAGVMWPSIDFQAAEPLRGEARGELMRRMVKYALSKRTEDEFAAVYTEMLRFFIWIESSLECSWVNFRLLQHGCEYFDPDGTKRNLCPIQDDDRIARTMMVKSGSAWDDWREVHKANLAIRDEEYELFMNTITKDFSLPYSWTGKDAEECAAFYTEGHWLRRNA